jgi:hypothetical protein
VENFLVFNKGGTAGKLRPFFWDGVFLFSTCACLEDGTMKYEKKVTLADALSKLLLTQKYNRGEAISVTELFA